MQRFFFYGTLQRGGQYYQKLGLANRAHFLGEDRIVGRLYDCGPWPAGLIGSGGFIHGELFETSDPALVAEIDTVEGFDPDCPESSEYIPRIVHTVGGVLAITYHYNRPVDGMTPLPSGRWPLR